MHEGPERIDYKETSDVTEVHAAIAREKGEPSAEVTPVPLWLTAVCALAVAWAGAYVGAFNGGFKSTIFNEYESSAKLMFTGPEQKGGETTGAVVEKTLAEQGKQVFSNCQPCHQASGLGIAGQFPPLVGSEWVVGSEKRMVAILLKGIQGPFDVEGKKFNGAMPAWEATLTDKKIAAVISYVRSEWGNSAPEVSEAKVAAGRKEFASRTTAWSEAELLQIPADATLPDAGGAAKPADVAKPAADAKAPASAPTAEAKPSSEKPAVQAAAKGAATAPDPEVLALGKKNYMTICIACHQPTGLGLPGVFPPLADSHYAQGNPERFAAMILKGNAGPMTVKGMVYNQVMPGQELVLTDDKIAAIMTFVRSSFGNNAPPVAPEVVAAARKKYADRKTPWTEAELNAFEETPAPAH